MNQRRRVRGGHVWLGLLLLGSLVNGESCLDCHDDAELTLERAGQDIFIGVSEGDFSGTPHEGFECGDCHAGLDEEELPHADPIPDANVGCVDCHDELGESHSFHPLFWQISEETVIERGLRCSDCHSGHRIMYMDSLEFPFSKERQTQKCGICHEIQSMEFLHSAHAGLVRDADLNSPTCLGCHKYEHVVPMAECDPAEHKIHVSEVCIACHVEDPEIAGQTLYGTPFFVSFAESVHGKALYSGNPDAPTCIDCHGSHGVARSSDLNARVNQRHVVGQCSKCHEEAAKAYLDSIHAKVFEKGYDDAPVCTDCHGEHNIMAHTDPKAPVAAANLSEQVCGECHGSLEIANRFFELEPDRLSTFEESFHGLAARGGAEEIVNCASCHGYHDVLAETNPMSPVHPDRLAETCGQCHEGANQRFAMGKVHVTADSKSHEPVLYWISRIYIWAILVIVGGMFLHNLLDFFHKVRLKATAHMRDHLEGKEIPHRLYVRMTLNERLQHGTLVISFVILVITGFMLKFPDAWWVEGLRNLNSNIFEFRSLLHRIAGVAMCVAGTWHIAYLFFTPSGRKLLKDLLPEKKDLTDMKGVFLYNIGLSKQKPLFKRFCYIEKAEYWALVWGSIVMTLTGFLLWFENFTIGQLTLLGFDISLVIHYYEAILASLAIIVWHFYFVIFNPDVYPMNLSWLTGKMSEEEMLTEHPLELERLKREEKE